MVTFDPSRSKIVLRSYQVGGVTSLLDKPRYGLFWTMRLGKSAVVINAACALFDAGELDCVVVACPAQVKSVWLDSEWGEIAKHSWTCPSMVDYCVKNEKRIKGPKWIITSYEFLRQENANGDFTKVEGLLTAMRGLRWWLVCDEMSALGNHKALQSKAVMRFGEGATRITGLDGTPVGNSPMEQWSKFEIVKPGMLGYKNFWQFRSVHAVVRRVPWTKSGQVVGFQKQELIDAKVKPFCEYLGAEGLDLPEKVYSFFEARLKPKTWKLYEQMRDELIAELDEGTVTANHAAVKCLRLAQLCAGFIGGLDAPRTALELPAAKDATEVSRESTDAFIEWLEARLKENSQFKCVVWCRWRAEIERLQAELHIASLPGINIGVIYGSCKTPNFLHPDSPVPGGGVMICQPQAAQYGVSFARADTEVFLSQDYNRVSRAQAEERVQGIGIRKSTYVVDCLVSGPNGERTITHDIFRSLRDKEEVARRTVEGWRKALA